MVSSIIIVVEANGKLVVGDLVVDIVNNDDVVAAVVVAVVVLKAVDSAVVDVVVFVDVDVDVDVDVEFDVEFDVDVDVDDDVVVVVVVSNMVEFIIQSTFDGQSQPGPGLTSGLKYSASYWPRSWEKTSQ